MSSNLYDIVVIGGGCVPVYGYIRSIKSTLIWKIAVEKENRVSADQTGRNSGVIHSGNYYKPGSYKAKNCVSGRRGVGCIGKKNIIFNMIYVERSLVASRRGGAMAYE